MYVNYYESAEALEITRARALKELADHDAMDDLEAFDEEVKPLPNGNYDAQAVLDWLGY